MRLLPILLLSLPALAAPPDKPLVELKASSPPAVKMMIPKAPKLETVPVAPQPAPSRGTITKEVRYYIDSPVALTVFSSPAGGFTAVLKKGPLTVVSKFVDQPTEFVEKEFKGPYVYWLDPKLSGTWEIIAVPEAVKSEKDVFRQMVDVDAGEGPRPPPIPPKPKPDDPLPVAKSFRVIIGFESAKTYPQPVINVLYGNVVEEWLNANCTGGKAGWRRRDQSLGSENDPTMAALWKAVKDSGPTPPFFAVEVNGKVEVIPFEPTPAEMVAKLQTYKGGK